MAQRILARKRMAPIYLAALIVALAAGYRAIADSREARYEASAERDPATRVMKGFEPRVLGPENADRAVLMVHGFVGCAQNFNDLPDRIAARGWRVNAMLLPGHGTNPSDFEKTTTDDLIAGVRKAAKELAAKHKTVVLLGHSMGGALVTYVASEEPVAGLVLCAPFFGLDVESTLGPSKIGVTNFAASTIRWIPTSRAGVPINLAANREKNVAYRWVPIRGASAALGVRERAARPEVYAKLTMPTLLVHSCIDKATDFNAAEKAVKQFAAVDKTVVRLEKSNHVIFWDYEAEETAHAIETFLAKWDSMPVTAKS